MTADLVLAQLSDPFRIGLIIALVVTMLRTRGATGVALPLAAGVLFVAYIIPATMGSAVPLVQAVGAGVVANALLVAAVLGIWMIVKRLRG